MADEFLKTINKLIENYEKRHEALHNKWEKMQNELMDLRDKIALAHEMIGDYMNTSNIPPTTITDDLKSGSLNNKSYPQMVIEIAKSNGGILNMVDAVEIIQKENPRMDKKTIQKGVGSAVYRYKDHFVWLKRGQYRYTNHVQTDNRPVQSKSDKRGEPSGVKIAVLNLKQKHPQMTLHEATDYLIKSNFDFKDKNPTKAVNMAWVNLGYSKEGKQQPLPITTPVQTTSEQTIIGIPSVKGIITPQ